MYKLICYDVAMTFHIIFNLFIKVFGGKFIERVRVIKKGNEKDLWEILDPNQFERRFGGNCPNMQDGQFWPPKVFGKDNITLDEIIENELMTFDWIGHQSDKLFFTSYTPWVQRPQLPNSEPQWMDDNGPLDVVYVED